MRMVIAFALSFPLWLVGQTYDNIYPPESSTSNWAAYCFDENEQLQFYCPVTITIGGYSGSNAHFSGHSGFEGSPLVLADVTCDNYFQCSPSSASGGDPIYGNTWTLGYVPLTMVYKLVGFAQCLNVTGPNGGGSLNFAVGYNDIYYNDHPEVMYPIGGTNTGGGSGHGNTWYNRYMPTGAAYSHYYATLQYLANHSQEKICTNDMALPFGGKFDLDRNWLGPHDWHDRGVAVDVAVTGSGQSFVLSGRQPTRLP